MATENELAALADALRNATGAANTKAAAESRAAQGLKEFSSALSQAPNALGRFAAGVAQGNAEFKQFNSAIDLATGAAAGLAKMIPYFGEAASAALKAAAEGAKYLVGQLDEVNQTFRDFAKVGALGAEGMTGLLNGITQSGLSMQGYRKIILSNSEALAAMGGMVSLGAAKFSEAVGELTKDGNLAGQELRNLGLNADGIAEAAAAFVARETRLGRAQTLTAQQLAAGTAKYAKELDEIAKITGASKDALVAQQDAAMSEARFAAETQDMRRKGLDPTNLMNFQAAISQMAPALGQGIRDLSTGNATTDAAKQLISSSGGVASKILEDLKNNLIAPGEAAQRLQAALKQNESAIIQHGKAIGNDSGTFSDIGQIIKFLNRDLSKWGETVTNTQNEQGKGTDKFTTQVVQSTKDMEAFGRIVREITVDLLPLTAEALKMTTNSFIDAIGLLPGSNKIDSETLKKELARRAAEREQADREAEQRRREEGPSPQRRRRRPAPEGPGLQSEAPSTRSVAVSSRRGGGRGGGGGANATGSPIAFGGGSGTRQSFAGLDSSLQAAVMGAAQSFYDTTGQPLMITSAKRSRADQERLYNDYITGRSPYPAAPPGTSAHEQGHAVDIGNFNAAMEQLYAAGLRQTVAGDPVHFQLSAATGGILSGPRSGYAATLHGTEAVVPLPDGRSIPVQNVNSGASAEQLDRLDTIISVMRDQVTATKKLLQYAS